MIDPVPRPKLPHLQHERSRHGLMVWYARVGKGPRIRLRASYGSPEFMAEYRAAVEREAAQPAGKAAKGTLRWLVARWRESSDWAATTPATRRQRENILLHVLETAGDEPYTAITAKVILAGRERRMATPFAANNFLKTMRALFRWAKASQFVNSDPAAEVSFLSGKTQGFTPWTIDDVARFRARWPLGTRQRVALEVLLNTGLRRGDAVRLGKQHIRDGVATIKAEKTGVTLYLPILPALAEAIEAGPVGDLAFITSERGTPVSKESFGNWFRRACNMAGVKASAHGVRKLAASTVAEGGGSEKELQALFGWVSNAQSQLYTREADNRRLAIQGAMRLIGKDR